MKIDHIIVILFQQFFPGFRNMGFDGNDFVDMRIGRENSPEAFFGEKMNIGIQLQLCTANDRCCKHYIADRAESYNKNFFQPDGFLYEMRSADSLCSARRYKLGKVRNTCIYDSRIRTS